MPAPLQRLKMQVQKFTVQYAKRFILLALLTEGEPFCSYTPYLLRKGPSWATEKAVSTASWLLQRDQVQPLGGTRDFPSPRAAEHVQLQSCREKAAHPLPPAPQAVPAQHAKSRKACLERAISQDDTKNCLFKRKTGQKRRIHLQRHKSRIYKFLFLFCCTEHFRVPLFAAFILCFCKTWHQRFRACSKGFGTLIHGKGAGSFTSNLRRNGISSHYSLISFCVCDLEFRSWSWQFVQICIYW